MTGVRIYELTPAIAELLDAAEGGELTGEAIERLEALTTNLDDKVDQYGRHIRNLESFVAVRKAEIDRLEMGTATAKNTIARLKELMRVALAAGGLTSHQTALFKIWRQANAPRAVWTGTDVEAVDPRFVKVTKEVLTGPVLDLYKETGRVPEGFRVERGEHLRLK